MNERIQELAQQAGIHPVNFEPDADLAVPLTAFAELIVRECAEVADRERPTSLGCGYITKTKGMLIKEYFGVKK